MTRSGYGWVGATMVRVGIRSGSGFFIGSVWKGGGGGGFRDVLDLSR